MTIIYVFDGSPRLVLSGQIAEARRAAGASCLPTRDETSRGIKVTDNWRTYAHFSLFFRGKVGIVAIIYPSAELTRIPNRGRLILK